MTTCIIEHTPSENKAEIVLIFANGQTSDVQTLHKVIVKEALNRVFIRSVEDSDKEYFSIPLANCIVKTTHY